MIFLTILAIVLLGITALVQLVSFIPVIKKQYYANGYNAFMLIYILSLFWAIYYLAAN